MLVGYLVSVIFRRRFTSTAVMNQSPIFAVTFVGTSAQYPAHIPYSDPDPSTANPQFFVSSLDANFENADSTSINHNSRTPHPV